MNKKAITKLFFFMVLLLFVLFMNNSTVHAAAQGETIVSDIVTTFHNQLSKYESVMLKYAKIVFYWCAVLEVAYLGIRMALGVAEMRDIIKNFCLTLLAAGFFLAVINNYHTWSWNLINGLKSIAGEATTIVDASDRPFTVGLELAQKIFEKIELFEPAKSLGYVLAGLVVLFCFALVTMQIILIKCECIVAMCASSILLGLGATSFLRDYAVNTLKYIFAVAFKLMTMQLVLGVGIGFIEQLQRVEQTSWDQVGLTICFCVIFFCLVKTLPDVVAGIIQGSHVSTGSALTSTVAALGATVAGLGMVAGSAANIGRAAMAARAQGAEGFGGMVRGTADNLWQAGRQAHYDKQRSRNTVSSVLREQMGRGNVQDARETKEG